MNKRYYCTHCTHSFEAPEKKGLECPACFWTTTVVLAEEVSAKTGAAARPQKESRSKILNVFLLTLDALKPLFFAALRE